MAIRLMIMRWRQKSKRLQKIIGKQVIEIEVLKNGRTVSEKINAVKELKEKRGSVKESCELLGISRSSYYG